MVSYSRVEILKNISMNMCVYVCVQVYAETSINNYPVTHVRILNAVDRIQDGFGSVLRHT